MDNTSGLFQIQKLQTGEVTSCDLNVNFLLAIGSSDKKVSVLEWKTGLGFVDMFYSPLNFHKYGITSVRFSPKGTMLISASFDGTAVLIDVLTGTKIFTMVQHNTSNIRFCEFTFDSTRLLTAADDGMLCVWSLPCHRQIRHCQLHEDDYTLKGLALSPDSEYLLSVDSGDLLKVWYIGDVLHNQPHCFMLKKNLHEGILSCDFSPVKNVTGGTFLKLSYCIATCGADGLAKIWSLIIEKGPKNEDNLDYFKCNLFLFYDLNHKNDILAVKFNSRGNHVVTSGLDNVKLWEVSSGKCLKSLEGHTRHVTCAAFSKDSALLATGSIDKTLIIWDLSESLNLDSELLIPCTISCHFTNINAINYSIKSSVTDEAETYKEFTLLQKITFSYVVNCIQFQGNDILAIAGGSTITIWRKKPDKVIFEEEELLKEHECSIKHLDISPCGSKIVSCSADGMMIYWNLNMNLTYKMKTPDCSGSLKTCKFSPDFKFIVAAGDDQKVYLWDAKTLEFIKIIEKHENAVAALAFTPDSELLVSISGSDIILQNFNEIKFTAKINNAHDLGVFCCDFLPIKIPEANYTTAYSDHGDTKNNERYVLATGGNDSLVKLWKVSPSGISSLKSLSGHGGTINCVKFSSEKPFILASCSNDNTIRIWDTSRKLCLHILNYHQSAVTTCSFSKDSILLVTGSLDKNVLIFNLTEKSCHSLKESDQNSNKILENWTTSELVNWFYDFGSPEIADKIQAMQLSGREVVGFSEDSIADYFGLSSEKEKKQFKFKFSSLKKNFGFPFDVPQNRKNIPHKFLCPLTHQIMKDPVICTDGYTYDRTSITEWFLGGKLFSPITKERLKTTKFLSYLALKINIYKFLYENKAENFD